MLEFQFDILVYHSYDFLVIYSVTLMGYVFIYSFTPYTLKDVLFVNSGDPWNPRPETVTQVKAMLGGVHRVLKPDGIFISISFGQVERTIQKHFFRGWVWVLSVLLFLL